MDIDEHLRLWDHATVKILDVRQVMLDPHEKRSAYRLPASFFLLVTRGRAYAAVDGVLQMFAPFKVVHGGKGTQLEIVQTLEALEYYLICYKATMPLSCKSELLQALEQHRPFHAPFAMEPRSPLALLDIVQNMQGLVGQEGQWEKLRIKSLFYQFLLEVYGQLRDDHNRVTTTDPVTQAMTYMKTHFAQPITVEFLADMFGLSPGYMARRFKSRTGTSVIEYVIQIRIQQAKTWLSQTDASLQEISSRIGYEDVYYFSRLFKKRTGLSPIEFKMSQRQHNPSARSESSIVPLSAHWYIDDVNNENHYHYLVKRKDPSSMYKMTRSSLPLTGLLSLLLFLSACSGGASLNAQPVSSQNTSSAEAQTKSAEQAVAQTKTVSTIFGDVVIPAKANRIVTNNLLSSILAVGVTPVGALKPYIDNPFISQDVAGVESIGEEWTVSLEKVVALSPDLIIIDTNDKSEYEKYAKIAPTVAVPFGTFKNDHEEVRYYGKLLGREAEAEAWLAEYDRRAEAAKKKVEGLFPAGETFALMRWESDFRILGNRWGRGGQAIYDILQLNPPPIVKQELWGDTQQLSISEEVLDKYAGDHIFIVSGKDNRQFESNPMWKQLKAVKEGKVYWFESERYSYWDPITTIAQAEEIADMLVAKYRK